MKKDNSRFDAVNLDDCDLFAVKSGKSNDISLTLFFYVNKDITK